jgi:hypothetical protein
MDQYEQVPADDPGLAHLCEQKRRYSLEMRLNAKRSGTTVANASFAVLMGQRPRTQAPVRGPRRRGSGRPAARRSCRRGGDSGDPDEPDDIGSSVVRKDGVA